MHPPQAIKATYQWIESFVIGLDLCPFAGREWQSNRVSLVVSTALSLSELLTDLESALISLQSDASIETLLLIHPDVLQDFNEYNQSLDDVDSLLIALKFEGQFQVATFHPDYQFAGTQPHDAENYTNRSPYPMLHILREASLKKAIASYESPDKIPNRNIALMEQLGTKALAARRQKCFDL